MESNEALQPMHRRERFDFAAFDIAIDEALREYSLFPDMGDSSVTPDELTTP